MATTTASVHNTDDEPVGVTPTDAHAKSTSRRGLCREITLSFLFLMLMMDFGLLYQQLC